MKRTLLALFAVIVCFGCSSNKDDKKSAELPVCSITSPQNGAILGLYEDVVIKGTASDPDGTIMKVNLMVDNTAVAEVRETPFTYTIPFSKLKEGTMKITLSVEDDGQNVATKEITVTIQDNSEAPVCRITVPAHGAELNVFSPFTIKGEGEAVSGEISKVVLAINDKVIEGVSSLPFEYEVKAGDYKIGACIITLDVENSRGKKAKDMVTVALADLNIAPTCSITAPKAGATYEAEDAIVIRGIGSDIDGTITGTTLKINDNVISEVTSVPFEYTLPKALKVPGNMRISLEVTDNNGKTATNEVTVSILGQFRQFTDTRDNKTYQTVKIDNQVWFAENLAYLPQVMKASEGSETVPHYYVYNYDGNDVSAAKATDSYKTRGVLYNWPAAGGTPNSKNDAVPSGVQGPCPSGWHIPSEAEWDILYSYVRTRIPDSEAVTFWDGSLVKNVSGHLRSKGEWPLSPDPDFPQLALGGFDTYGFKTQATGQWLSRMFYKGPESGGNSITFWMPHYDAVTYPKYPGGVSTSMSNYKYEIEIGRGTSTDRGYSVRCLQD